MLATFRNIAAVCVASYAYYVVAGTATYLAQFAGIHVTGRSDRTGSVVLMHLVGSIFYILLSFPAGVLVSSAVRPKAETKWILLFIVLFAVQYFLSFSPEVPITASLTEDTIGVLLAVLLIVAGVLTGAWKVRQSVLRQPNSR